MTDAERRETLERLMLAHGTQIKRFCTLQLRDAALAEDAAQEVFVKAWKGLASFRAECGEKTWLTRIAVNTCRDYQRTGWFRFMDRSLTPEELADRSVPDTFPDGTVSQAIAKLPREQRMAVLLRYYEGLTIREVAHALGVCEATAKRRLRKANALLRNMLERWYSDVYA